MKKLLAILSTAVICASTLLITGCKQEGDEIINMLQGPTNTWCEMPVQYKNSDNGNSANLYAYFYYSDKDVTGSSTTSKSLKKGTTIPAGLTIVVTANPEIENENEVTEVITGLTKNAYIMKTFPKDSEVSLGEGNDTLKITGSREKWTAIWLLKSDLRKTENHDTNPPSQLSNGGSGTELSIDSIKDQFSWKKLVANYLLNSL